jgi:hypothetical protein
MGKQIFARRARLLSGSCEENAAIFFGFLTRPEPFVGK